MRAAALKPIAGAFLLGVLTVGGFAPFYLFPLPVITLALLIRIAERMPKPSQ